MISGFDSHLIIILSNLSFSFSFSLTFPTLSTNPLLTIFFPFLQDTAGQERYHSLGPIYYRDAKGAILVYDITDIDSFVKVKKWVKELHSMVGTNIAIAICGNKIDKEREKVVDLHEAERYLSLLFINIIH